MKKGRGEGGRGRSRGRQGRDAAPPAVGAGDRDRPSPGSGRGEGKEPLPIPGWSAPALYALVTVLLFREFIFSDDMLLGMDTLSLGYMARAFFADALRAGTFPLWNPVILGGTPFLESLAGGDSLYPPSLILLLALDPVRALGWKLVMHVFLAGVLMYGWCRALDRSRLAAGLAGLGYMLAPFLVTLVFPGHDGKLFVTALAPLVFWMAERSLTARTLLPFVGLSGSVALVILTTHFQMAYFLFGSVGIYAVVRWIQEGSGGRRSPAGARFAGFLLAAVVGAGAAGVQLIPAVEYITESSRRSATTVGAESPEAARAYSASWSLHPEEIMSLVIPEFVGNSAGGTAWATDTYWGRNPFKLNHEYIGLVLLILAGLSFLGGPRPWVRWTLAGIGGAGLLFTLGAHSPLWHLLYAVLPGVGLFRAPSMVIFVTGFAVATLAAFGVDRGIALARGSDPAGWRRASLYLWGCVGVLAVVTLLAATGALTGAWSAIFEAPLPGREGALETLRPHLVRGAFVATLLAGCTAGVWWALRAGYLAPAGVGVALAILLAADGFRISDPFVRTVDRRQVTQPDANIRFLQAQQQARPDDPFRVLSLAEAGQDVTPGQFGLELMAGHHPNDLLRYRELIGMEGSGFPEHVFDGGGGFNTNLLAILNVGFLLWPDYDPRLGSLQGPEPASRITFPDGRPFTSVYALPTLPRAYLVGEALVRDDEGVVDFLLSPAFDPASQVVVAEIPPGELAGAGVGGEVRWLRRETNRLELEVEADGPALLVISENWFPAWRAEVDGTPAPVLRANHTLRAVPVPAGRSTVELVYHSRLLMTSLWISVLSLILMAGGAGYSLLRRRRRDDPGGA